MVESDSSAPYYESRVRQQVTVPFQWEEKPGTPKRDWKPEIARVSARTASPPAKLVKSITFKWEEKPGKPLSCFSKPQESPVLPLPPAKCISFSSPLVYSPYSSSSIIRRNSANTFEQNSETDNSNEDNDEEEEEYMDRKEEELDLRALNFKTDEPLKLVPSLLANRLLTERAISSAVPVNEYTVRSSRDGYETPSSPASETDSSASSYATGSTNLTGPTFLECAFPLFSPDSGFLDRLQFHEKSSSFNLPNPYGELAYESNSRVEKTPTLGELIRMSCKIGGRGKSSNETRKRNSPMEFLKKRVFGCFMFKSGGRALRRKLKGSCGREPICYN